MTTLRTLKEKVMAPHSRPLAWNIPWSEEPGRLQSMGLLRVGHNWATSLSLFTFMHWRRKWQPAPVFLPGEAQGRGSLVGCRLWGRTESDTTEQLSSSSSSLKCSSSSPLPWQLTVLSQSFAVLTETFSNLPSSVSLLYCPHLFLGQHFPLSVFTLFAYLLGKNF